MFRRAVYHIVRQPLQFLHSAVIYIVLFLFLLSSGLTSGLIDVFNDIASQSMNLTVKIVSPFTDPTRNIWPGKEFIANERNYVNAVHKLNAFGSFQNKDLEVIYRFPLVSSYIDDDGSIYSLPDVRSIHEADLWEESLMPVVNFEGIESDEPEILNNGQINVLNGSFISQSDIENDHLVCVLPLTYAFYIGNDGKNASLPVGSDFNISTFAFDADHNVTAYRTWKLTVLGFYSQSYSADNYMNCIYIPRGAIEKIRDEALSFQEENASALLNESIQNYQISTIYPAAYQCNNLSQMEDFIRYVQNTEAYQNKEISVSSELSEMAPVLTSLYTTTSSFRIITGVIFIIAVIFAMVNTGLECIYRKKEMTLLQTMGERKRRITGQMLMEKIFILVLSLSVSMPLAMLLVQRFAVTLFTSSMNDRDNAIGEAVAHSFSTYKAEISVEQISSRLHFSSSLILVVALFIFVLLLIQAAVIRKMLNDFKPRNTLSGGDS